MTAAQVAILRRAAADSTGCYRLGNSMMLDVARSLEIAGLGIVIGMTFQLTPAGRTATIERI